LTKCPGARRMQRGTCPTVQPRGWFVYSCIRLLLALSAALLLALPPGWCCFPLQRSPEAGPTAPKRECCHGGAAPGERGPAPSDHEAPAAPASSCCCLTDTTLPPTPQTPPADSTSAPLVLPDGIAAHPTAADPIPASAVHSPPPPRLLHCLWLC
jgi:hypothetical protein